MSEIAARILCVDDETNVQNALRRALRKEPYETLFASSPLEALEILEREPIDIVISDHMMPEMTGLELIRKISARWPHILRFILTGHADLEMAIDAINRGEVYRFLTKPWENVELKVTLRLAVSRIALEKENRELLEMVKRQSKFITALEQTYSGITAPPGSPDPDGPIIVTASEFSVPLD